MLNDILNALSDVASGLGTAPSVEIGPVIGAFGFGLACLFLSRAASAPRRKIRTRFHVATTRGRQSETAKERAA